MRLSWMSIVLTALPAAAQDGSLWVGLEGSPELVRLDPDGVDASRIALPMPTATIAVAHGGEAWALDEEGERVVRLAPHGGLLSVTATPRRPLALLVDGRDRAWVLSGRDRVLVAYTPHGVVERSLPITGGATDVVLDAFLRFHVAARGSLFTYDEEGRLLRRVRGLGGVDRVGLSHFGDVLAVNTRRGRIHTIPHGAEEGRLLVDLPGRITAPVVDGNGRLWFALPKHDLLVRMDRTGSGLMWLPTASEPTSVGLGVDGDVWVACAGAPALQRFANSGKLRTTLPLTAPPCLKGDPAGAYLLAHARALDDLDLDGYSNRNEWVAATNPTNAASVPAWIDVQGGNGTWNVRFGVANPAPSAYVAYLTSFAWPGTLLSDFDGADLRRVPTSVVDPVFLLSGEEPSMLDVSRGRLDVFGRASATVHLPPELRGLGISFAFVTIDRDGTVSPNSLRVISNAVPLID